MFQAFGSNSFTMLSLFMVSSVVFQIYNLIFRLLLLLLLFAAFVVAAVLQVYFRTQQIAK
jgi:hypothetical protein